MDRITGADIVGSLAVLGAAAILLLMIWNYNQQQLSYIEHGYTKVPMPGMPSAQWVLPPASESE